MTVSNPDADQSPAGADAPEEPKVASANTPTRQNARKNKPVHDVAFVAYPKFWFVWPLILAGLVFYPFTPPHQPVVGPADVTDAEAAPAEGDTAAEAPTTQATATTSGWLEGWGWAYIWIAFVVLLALGVDVDRNHAVFWAVLIAAVWILGMWLQDRNYTIVGDIYRWFAGLDVQYNRNLGLALSVMLLVPYLIMLGYARLNDRWRITHNEFEHYSFGKADDSIGRGAKSIRSAYPDVLELLIGMAGTLIVFNATGTKELRRIRHVVLLPFVRQRLNKILERTAITGLAGIAEEEEEDDEDT